MARSSTQYNNNNMWRISGGNPNNNNKNNNNTVLPLFACQTYALLRAIVPLLFLYAICRTG